MVTADNEAPVIESAPVTNARIDELYQYKVQAIDPRTGTVSWKPGVAQGGSTDVELAVNGPAGASATQRFAVGVTQQGKPPYLANNMAPRRPWSTSTRWARRWSHCIRRCVN